VNRSRLRSLCPPHFCCRPGTASPNRPPRRFRNIGPAAMGVASTTSRCSRATPSIGDVAIAPNDANVVWVGTGENNNRQSSSCGTGVFKSTDGGHSWKLTGLADTRHIARLVDPIDHDVVYVAALDHLSGPNRERGVYKTTDGGASWTNVRGSFLRAGTRRHSWEAPCVSVPQWPARRRSPRLSIRDLETSVGQCQRSGVRHLSALTFASRLVAFVASPISIPAMIVEDVAAASFPMPGEIPPAAVVRRHPIRVRVRRQRPVTVVPRIAAHLWVPIALDPGVPRPGWRRHSVHTRWRWRFADANIERNLCVGG